MQRPALFFGWPGVNEFFTGIQHSLDLTPFDAQEIPGPGKDQGVPLGGERDGRFGSLFLGTLHRQVEGQAVVAVEIRQAALGMFGLVLCPKRPGGFENAGFFRGRQGHCRSGERYPPGGTDRAEQAKHPAGDVVRGGNIIYFENLIAEHILYHYADPRFDLLEFQQASPVPDQPILQHGALFAVQARADLLQKNIHDAPARAGDEIREKPFLKSRQFILIDVDGLIRVGFFLKIEFHCLLNICFEAIASKDEFRNALA